MKIFWMIWREGSQGFAVQHWSREDARREAERLARAYPPSKFHVLQVVGACVKNDVNWEEVTNEDVDQSIPF